jgi:hypothetical protein
VLESDTGWEETSVVEVVPVCAAWLVVVTVAGEAQALIKNTPTMKSERNVVVVFLFMILLLFGLK